MFLLGVADLSFFYQEQEKKIVEKKMIAVSVSLKLFFRFDTMELYPGKRVE